MHIFRNHVKKIMCFDAHLIANVLMHIFRNHVKIIEKSEETQLVASAFPTKFLRVCYILEKLMQHRKYGGTQTCGKCPCKHYNISCVR